MNTTETPETDTITKPACANWDNGGDHVRHIVNADLSRKLEKERNAAYAEIVRLRDAIQQALVTPSIVKDHVLSQALSQHNAKAIHGEKGATP